MTLRSASARTIEWIDAVAKRLLKRREGLCAQLTKFQDVHKALATCGISQVRKHACGGCAHAARPPCACVPFHRQTTTRTTAAVPRRRVHLGTSVFQQPQASVQPPVGEASVCGTLSQPFHLTLWLFVCGAARSST